MNKHESKYFSTAFLMDEALINLLEKKDINYITIKEICKNAGVNRSTFYLHYESIYELLEETIEYTNKKFISYFNKETKDFIKEIETTSLQELNLIQEQYLKPYLTFIKENKNIFKASLTSPNTTRSIEKYKSLEEHILIPIIKRYNIKDKEINYILSFYLQGIIAIIKEWISDNCNESTEFIEQIIIKCVNKE